MQNFDGNNRISGYSYDAAGNLLNDTFHAYTYDAEGRMKTVDTTAATYTYGPAGERTRKDVTGGWTEYVYFGGQMIAEKSSAGDWTDYIFANGQRVAKAEGLNRDLHIYGSLTGTGHYAVFDFANTAGLSGYTIASGDTLYLAQFQPSGSKGGMILSFTDGTNSNWILKDKEGYYLNDDQQQNATHFRTIDLSSLAGKTISKVAVVQETDTAAGAWHVYFDYISLLSANDTVHPIYTGQTASTLSVGSHTAGETGLGSTIDTNRGKATDVADTTTYYTADHLGSSRMIYSGFGYPVWSGVFLPFGQEWNAQMTMNTYKFTGDERDSESNLDHTQFRQLSTTQGRWLSPDPYMGSMDLTNPQSLNRYAYVLDDPLNVVDPLGLNPPCTATWDGTPCFITNANPGSDTPGGNGAGGAFSGPGSNWGNDRFTGWQCALQELGLPSPCVGEKPDSPGGGIVNPGRTFTLNPIGIIRQPGQTFKQCMATNASVYSIGGNAQVILNASTGKNTTFLTENLLASGITGNMVSTFFFGSTSEAGTTMAAEAPDVISRGIGSTTTFGRRTSDIMSLNLTGKGGLPQALGQASGGAKALFEGAGKALSLGLTFFERLVVDSTFTASEAINCY